MNLRIFVSSEPGPDGHLEYCSTQVISTVVQVTRMPKSQGKNYSQSGKGAKERLGSCWELGRQGQGQGPVTSSNQEWYGEEELEWAGTESSHKGRLQAQYN